MNDIVETSERTLSQRSDREIMDLFARWMRLDVADGAASPETLRNYASDVRHHLRWLAEHEIPPSIVTEDDLKLYRSFLVQQYALSTVGRKLVSIRRFYEMAHARGYLATNPAARLGSPRDLTNHVDRRKYLAKNEIERVLALPLEMHGATARGLRDLVVLSLMAIHGLRTKEISVLNVEDVQRDRGTYGILHVFGKGDKWRTVYLAAETRAMLDRWIDVRVSLGSESNAVIVTLHRGVRHDRKPYHRISRRSIRNIVDTYLRKAGVKRKGMSCHSLRHSAATHALEAGARLVDIQHMLGHENIGTTQIYAQIIDRDEHNPALKTAGILGDQLAEIENDDG